MKCKNVEYWLPAYIKGELDDLSEDPNLANQITAHLKNCQSCTRGYEEYKFTLDFIEENREIFAHAFEKINRERAEKAQIHSQKWAKIIAIDTEKPIKQQVIALISAVAACLMIGFVSWMLFSRLSKSPVIQENHSIEHIATAVQPSVKIEEISESGKVPLASGQGIVSSNQLKTLLVNETHRLVMDKNTTLSIKPLVSNVKIGCTINLESGRVYVHVEHDGNPFVVNTIHGKAIITGTTFDIESNQTKTKLIVTDGTVTFASQGGSLNVSAGNSSEIFRKSAPTEPTLCDTKQLTAWATGYELKTTLAKIEAISDSFDISELWLTANSGPVNLEKFSYEQWIEQKRDWFEGEFPLIFQLKEALAKENIETDYPQLLFASGDLWQFTYPQASNKQFSALTLDSLAKAASIYDFDKQWLIKNIPPTKSLNNNLTDAKGIFTGQEAFRQLIEQFEQARNSQNSIDSDILLYSLNAGTYLTKTRTLAWLYIANENIDLTPENKTDLLTLLQNEVNESEKIKEYVIRLFTISENCPCEEYNILINKTIDSINVIKEFDKALMAYQIGNRGEVIQIDK